MAADKPILTLKPNITVAIIPTIAGSLFAGLFIGFFAGFFLRSVGIGMTVGILTSLPTFFFRLMNLRARQYSFYHDKAEFYEGFLNIVQRTVQYEKVTDCILTKTIWDRMFGTGTIRLLTPGHEGSGRHAALGGGITIQYIEQPDEIYQRMQGLLKK